MGIFSKFTRGTKKVQNKNVMEAIVAGCLLVAAADGTIERSETDKMEKLINANDKLEPFKGRDVRNTIQRYTNILEADFGFGKKKMLDEIADIRDNQDDADEVFLNMIAICKSDGEIEPEELVVLREVAQVLGINMKDFGLTDTTTT